jgi:hypothetical protein
MKMGFLAFLNDFLFGDPNIPDTYLIPFICSNCGMTGRLLLKKYQNKTSGLEATPCPNCGFYDLREAHND